MLVGSVIQESEIETTDGNSGRQKEQIIEGHECSTCQNCSRDCFTDGFGLVVQKEDIYSGNLKGM